MLRIYLAGPEVFCRESRQLGLAKQSICARYHFLGLYPLDDELANDLPASDEPASERSADAGEIFARCVRLMHQAEAGIFNLTPFRGSSADVGTVFELGYMAAMGKPIFAYTHAAEDLIDRLRVAPGLALDADGITWRDLAGMSAEDFGLTDNLMLDRALAAQGRTVHRVAIPEPERFTRLDGFLACLENARAALPPD